MVRGRSPFKHQTVRRKYFRLGALLQCYRTNVDRHGPVRWGALIEWLNDRLKFDIMHEERCSGYVYAVGEARNFEDATT